MLVAMAPIQAEEHDSSLGRGEEPRWIRHPAIAPDGETLSFTHRGQVFLVDAEGGLAVPLTAQGSYSHDAVWAPDSERLAFASDISGTDSIYISDFSGTLQRSSWSSTGDTPTSFSPDGKSVLYTSLGLGDAERSVQAALSEKTQLYGVDTTTGRESLILPNFALEARWNPDATRLAYSYDPSTDPASRQHRVAANARQIWIYDDATGRHERLFDVDGTDRLNPVWSKDGTVLYYLSEASGWLNAWQVDLASGVETQLTFFEDAPVRDLSVADNGTLAFGYDGRIYVKAPADEAPRAIEILTLDQRASIDSNIVAGSATELVSSPDGERLAVVSSTDIFLLDRAGNYRQLTATPTEEKNVAFSPDGSMLVYAAQRGHEWGLYAIDLQVGESDDPLAIKYEEVPLLVPEEGNAFQPAFSPDGTRIAFVSDRREVKVLDLASGEVTALFQPSDYNSSYGDGDQWFAWSPTSQDILVQWRYQGGADSGKAAIVSADGSTPPQMVTQGLQSFSSGFWSADATQVIGETNLFGARSAQLHSLTYDLYRIFVSEAARQDFLSISEGNFPVTSDEEDAVYEPQRYEPDTSRARRLGTRLTEGIGDVLLARPLSDYANILLVTQDVPGEINLEVLNLRSGERTLMQTVAAPGLEAVSFVSALNVVDIKLAGTILSVPLYDPSGVSSSPARIFTTVNPDQRRRAAFEQAWADLKYRYYDSDLEGRDWEAIGAKYRSYLGSIATSRELADLVGAMYGELSASHLFTGFRGDESSRIGIGSRNDVLGVYLDYGYEGQGRRVAAVLPGGPLDRAGLGIDPGDIITSINGTPVPDAGGIERLLDINLGKRALIGVIDGEGAEERFVYVDPIDYWRQLGLARTRLFDARTELVDRLSNACVAYQYVPAMSNGPYLDVLGQLYGARDIAKAALIDVRSNGGGNLTRELITLLSGSPYALVGRDGAPIATEPNNRWVWPSAVLVDSFGYSDAAIFPQAYQDSGIGPLVGDTVLNTGTYVASINSKLVPGFNYNIPVLPSRRLDGSYYENHVIEPDIAVPFDPNAVGIGVDPQLEAAVEALMAQIGKDSDCRLPTQR
jgi:tricorn protease